MPSVSRSKLTWIRVESGIRKRAHDDDSTVYAVRVRRKGTPERTLTCPTLRDARKQRNIAGSQRFPRSVYVVESERLIVYGFRKHKVNKIKGICILGAKDAYGFDLSV